MYRGLCKMHAEPRSDPLQSLERGRRPCTAAPWCLLEAKSMLLKWLAGQPGKMTSPMALGPLQLLVVLEDFFS